jgi:hypothetical protein
MLWLKNFLNHWLSYMVNIQYIQMVLAGTLMHAILLDWNTDYIHHMREELDGKVGTVFQG